MLFLELMIVVIEPGVVPWPQPDSHINMRSRRCQKHQTAGDVEKYEHQNYDKLSTGRGKRQNPSTGVTIDGETSDNYLNARADGDGRRDGTFFEMEDAK